MGSSRQSNLANGGVIPNLGWTITVGSNSTYFPASGTPTSITVPMTGAYTLANGTNGTITTSTITFAPAKPFKRKPGWNAKWQERCAECGRFAVKHEKVVSMLFCKRCRGMVNRWLP